MYLIGKLIGLALMFGVSVFANLSGSEGPDQEQMLGFARFTGLVIFLFSMRKRN